MLVKKICIVAGLVAMGATSVSASEIINDNLGNGLYSYIGKGSSNDVIGNSNYDIYNMVVSRSDVGIMTVRINTKFVDINNSGYNFGDLMMSVKSGSDGAAWEPYGSSPHNNDDFQTTGTTWEYAYDLNNARYHSGNFTDTTSARLASLNNPTNASSYNYGSVRHDGSSYNDHITTIKQDFTNLNGGLTHSVQANTGSNYLEFIFDVTGTELATAEQIGFHWTMSCANDIIEGMANFGHNVPEPAALGLLLMGLTGMGFARRRKQVA